MSTVSFAEATFKCPVFQIGRRENLHFLSHCEHHDPAFCCFVPKNFRVAEITSFGYKYGVVFVFGESASVVSAISDALYLTVAVLCIDGDDCACSEAGCIVMIYHGRAAEDSTKRIRCYRNGAVFPVYEVFADSVSPVHVSPFGAIRVVLVKKMVFTVFIDHSVRVVHPSVKGREVIGRTKLFTVGRIEGVGEFHFLAASGIIRRKIDTDRIVGVHLELERDRFAGKVGKVYRNKVIYFMYGETHVEVFHLFIINDHADTYIGRRILYGQKQVVLGSIDTYKAMTFSQILNQQRRIRRSG